jgi:hypothetical protein
MRFLQFRFAKCQSKMLYLVYQQLQRRNKMAVSNATYKVGDTFTTQKSKVTGVIEEITPQANGNVRVKLMVDGKPRYTTWTSK